MKKKGGRKKKRSSPAKVAGFDELLGLLNKKPELVSALMFKPRSVLKHLKSKEAKVLVRGINPEANLENLINNNRWVVWQCSRMTLHH